MKTILVIFSTIQLYIISDNFKLSFSVDIMVLFSKLVTWLENIVGLYFSLVLHLNSTAFNYSFISEVSTLFHDAVVLDEEVAVRQHSYVQVLAGGMRIRILIDLLIQP